MQDSIKPLREHSLQNFYVVPPYLVIFAILGGAFIIISPSFLKNVCTMCCIIGVLSRQPEQTITIEHKIRR
jgi:hypothetical protein